MTVFTSILSYFDVLWGIVLVMVLWGAAGALPAPGQSPFDDVERDLSSLDRRVFYRIYDIDEPGFRTWMRAADHTAWPVFFGGPAAAWIGAWVLREGDDWTDTYRLTVSELGALAGVVGIKVLVHRERPYVWLPDVETRTGDIARHGPNSFPSGHAALSFAMATSFSLSHPQWYVIVPGYLWASGVSLSRVWLGVHYPSDVLAGAVLGTAVAVIVHVAGQRIIPRFLRKNIKYSTLRVRVAIY